MQYLLQPSMMETNAVGPSARGSGRRSNFDFREADIYNRAAVATHGVDHLRQTVQRLRPKNNIDIVGALANVLAFLRCHAATDADNQVRFFFNSFQRPN